MTRKTYFCWVQRLLLAVTLSLAGSAIADDGQQLRAEIQRTDSMLQHIRRAAMGENPQLRERQDEILGVVTAQMKAQGYDADAAIAEISDMQDRLRADDLDDEERQALMSDLEEAGEAFRAARAEAMASQPVKDFEAELERELVAAMIEIEPKTETLIADLEALREQLAALEEDASN